MGPEGGRTGPASPETGLHRARAPKRARAFNGHDRAGTHVSNAESPMPTLAAAALPRASRRVIPVVVVTALRAIPVVVVGALLGAGAAAQTPPANRGAI